MGRAEGLWEELKRDGVDAVRRLLDASSSEADYVEYKRAVEPKDNLSKAMCAFANTYVGL